MKKVVLLLVGILVILNLLAVDATKDRIAAEDIAEPKTCIAKVNI